MTMTWSRTRTLAAGVTLIAITNAVALYGVAYNRSGEPESRLQLSQRELWQPYQYGFDRESTGLTLNLQWRVPTADTDQPYPMGRYGSPAWLDQAKLASLGFDVTRAADTPAGERHYERLLPREVLVVLELDGPAYQQALQRAQKRADDEAARAATEPGKAGARRSAESAAEQLKREQASSSRLFAVDVGLDAAALRSQYRDRGRYAIVRGSVRVVYYGRGAGARLSGHLEGLSNSSISVPREFRHVFASMPRGPVYGDVAQGALPLQVTVAFGKRFEPWIVAASARRK